MLRISESLGKIAPAVQEIIYRTINEAFLNFLVGDFIYTYNFILFHISYTLEVYKLVLVLLQLIARKNEGFYFARGHCIGCVCSWGKSKHIQNRF